MAIAFWEVVMRVFLAAVLAAIVLAGGALFALSTTQRVAGAAYSTEGARINPTWSWRSMIRRSPDQAAIGQKMNPGAGINPTNLLAQNHEPGSASDACEQASALRWLFVDFSETATADEGPECGS